MGRPREGREKAARANGTNEILALIPHNRAKGNREPRLSDEQLRILDTVINSYWRTSEARNFKSCYRELQVACHNAGIKSPSYPTLISTIKAQEENRDLRTRHGKRIAYQQGGFVEVLYADTPVHGSRPFQYVHIDHTQVDIELLSSRSGKNMGRPWLSLAVDSWSRRIVGFYLTYDPPSYRSVMMTLRDMVRRFNRLPEFCVVDNGSDFRATDFSHFLQVMGTHLRYRPSGRARHGAVLERLFGRAHSEYIHNLAGNTKATKNVRMVSGKHLPAKLAEWNLEALYYGIQYWATEYYDQERHQALDCSPREAFLRGLHSSGHRPHRKILFNQEFMIATCPRVGRTGERKIDGQRGVKVNDMFYWHPDFRDLRIAGKELSVRYDPWDASSVYVRYKDRWLQATCRNLLELGQLTELERRALTEEYMSRSGAKPDSEASMQRLREFMQTFTPEGAMAVTFERQQENKSLYNSLELGAITPVPVMQKTRLIKDISESASAENPRTSLHERPGTHPEANAPDQLPDFDLL